MMAQATHGSAPDIAGRGIANSYAMVLSGKMMIEYVHSGTSSAPAPGAGARRTAIVPGLNFLSVFFRFSAPHHWF